MSLTSILRGVKSSLAVAGLSAIIGVSNVNADESSKELEKKSSVRYSYVVESHLITSDGNVGSRKPITALVDGEYNGKN